MDKYDLVDSVDLVYLMLSYDLKFGCIDTSDPEHLPEEIDLYSTGNTHFAIE